MPVSSNRFAMETFLRIFLYSIGGHSQTTSWGAVHKGHLARGWTCPYKCCNTSFVNPLRGKYENPSTVRFWHWMSYNTGINPKDVFCDLLLLSKRISCCFYDLYFRQTKHLKISIEVWKQCTILKWCIINLRFLCLNCSFWEKSCPTLHYTIEASL
jgi:hypothetical protein